MTYLIPVAYVTDTCFLSDNIPQKKFESILGMAQDDLKVILHAPLYNDLVSQYEATTTTFNAFTAENQALRAYYEKFLAWRTVFYLQKFANYSATPTGNRTFKDDNSDLLSDVQQFSYEKNLLERATFYRNEMINYMRECRENNSSAYAKWVDDCKELFCFAISSVQGKSGTRTEIFKSTRYNE